VTTDAEWDDMVLVGIVARTHGNRGQVIVNSESDFAKQRFRPGATLFARGSSGGIETLRVRSVRFQQGRPILGFEDFASIDDAERLAGAALKVPAGEQQRLPDGTFYHHELIGCDVVTAGGEAIGKVAAVEGVGDTSRLVVRGSRREVLIPLAQEICSVDVQAKRIVVTPPEGLLEVNGDWRE
jgi:16S rRNA processing protein RimM